MAGTSPATRAAESAGEQWLETSFQLKSLAHKGAIASAALMLRRCDSTVSKHEGVSSAHWNLLRDAASPLLRMRSE
jgi:hypothetical protein